MKVTVTELLSKIRYHGLSPHHPDL